MYQTFKLCFARSHIIITGKMADGHTPVSKYRRMRLILRFSPRRGDLLHQSE